MLDRLLDNVQKMMLWGGEERKTGETQSTDLVLRLYGESAGPM